MKKVLLMGAFSALFAVSAGCMSQKVDIGIGNPTGPTSSGDTTINLQASAPAVNLNLSNCTAIITLTATVSTMSAQSLTWSYVSTPTANLAVDFKPNGTTALLTVNRDGVYAVTVKATPSGVSKTVTVTVEGACVGPSNGAQFCDLQADKTTLVPGEGSNLAWVAQGYVSTTKSWTTNPALTGVDNVKPTQTTTYTLTCVPSSGPPVIRTKTIIVNNGPGGGAAPTLDFSGSPTQIGQGQSSVLSWSGMNLNSPCTATGGWTGTRPVSDTYRYESVTPLALGNHTYTLSCTGVNGTVVTRSVVITVVSAPASACTLTQALTPSSGSGDVGQKMTVQAKWSGASCPGWYYSTDPSKVGVNPTTGEVSFVSKGSVSICGQPSVANKENPTCGPFTTK